MDRIEDPDEELEIAKDLLSGVVFDIQAAIHAVQSDVMAVMPQANLRYSIQGIVCAAHCYTMLNTLSNDLKYSTQGILCDVHSNTIATMKPGNVRTIAVYHDLVLLLGCFHCIVGLLTSAMCIPHSDLMVTMLWFTRQCYLFSG